MLQNITIFFTFCAVENGLFYGFITEENRLKEEIGKV